MVGTLDLARHARRRAVLGLLPGVAVVAAQRDGLPGPGVAGEPDRAVRGEQVGLGVPVAASLGRHAVGGDMHLQLSDRVDGHGLDVRGHRGGRLGRLDQRRRGQSGRQQRGRTGRGEDLPVHVHRNQS